MIFLADCNKTEKIDNKNMPKKLDTEQHEIVDISGDNILSYREKIKKFKNEYEELVANKKYAFDYVTLKKSGNDYLLKVVFKKIIKYVEAEEFEESGFYVFDDNDIKSIDIRLDANDVLHISDKWYLLDGTNEEMPSGDMKISELYKLNVFSYDSKNGLLIKEITDDEIIVSINMAGLT